MDISMIILMGHKKGRANDANTTSVRINFSIMWPSAAYCAEEVTSLLYTDRIQVNSPRPTSSPSHPPYNLPLL